MDQGYRPPQNWQHSPHPSMAPTGTPTPNPQALRQRARAVRQFAKAALGIVCALFVLRLGIVAARMVLTLRGKFEADKFAALQDAGDIAYLAYAGFSSAAGLITIIVMPVLGLTIMAKGRGSAIGGGLIMALTPLSFLVIDLVATGLLAGIYAGVTGRLYTPLWLDMTLMCGELLGMLLVIGLCWYGYRRAIHWARSVEQF